jgi:uncharacterized protein (TIGR02266 family)
MADVPEKRQDARVPLVLRVDYPNDADFIRDCTENLSAGGLFIRTERELAVGDRVPLVISFPALLDPIELEVEVVRRRPPGLNEPAGVAVKVPFDRPDERKALAQLAHAAQAQRDQPSDAQYRVLLVEDNPHVVEMYAYALKKLAATGEAIQVSVDFASNGHEAFERLCRPPPLNLVITDLYMPVMDGFTLVEKIRAEPKVKDTPVMIISAGGLEARERAADLGIDVYMQKPVKFLDIIQTVRTLLNVGGKK